ncbi:glycosyltransferase family 39 protein [bacterium]|nr:glycosyltransferase family 39 protein [bacterium]
MRLRTALFLATLAAAAVLRFAGLQAKSLWHDELLSWRLLEFPVSEMLERTGGTGTVHPPLFFICLRGWAAVSGDTEFALRSLPALLGVATVAGVYALVRSLPRLGGNQSAGDYDGFGGAAVLAAALVALNPMQIHLAQQARGYTLGTALVAWSSWALVRAIEPRGRAGGYWALYGGLALALCYTHHIGLFTVVSQWLFAGAYLMRPAAGVPAHGRQRARALFVAAAVAAGYAVWVPNLLGQADVVAEKSWQPPSTLFGVAHETYITVTSTFAHQAPVDPAEAWVVTALVGLSLAVLLVRGEWGGRLVAAIGLAPAACLLAYGVLSSPNLYYSRYLSFAEVGWLTGLAVVWTWMPHPLARAGWAAILLATSALSCHESWSVIGPEARPGARAAFAHVQQSRVPGELVVAGDGYTFLKASYYCPRQGERPRLLVAPANVSRVLRSAHFRSEDLITPDELAARKPAGVWFVHRGSPPRRLPAEYPEPAVAETFPSDYRWERVVVVEHRPRVGE